MASRGAPEVCLICHLNLKVSYPQSPGKCVKKLEDVIFTLKTLLQVPSGLLEGWIREARTTPGKWISFCGSCGEAVERGRRIYEEILNNARRFIEVQGNVRKRLRRSWRNGEEAMGRGREELKVTYECRRRISNGFFQQSGDVYGDGFLVQDVSKMTSSLLTRVPFPPNIYNLMLSERSALNDDHPDARDFEGPDSPPGHDDEGTSNTGYDNPAPLHFLLNPFQHHNIPGSYSSSGIGAPSHSDATTPKKPGRKTSFPDKWPKRPRGPRKKGPKGDPKFQCEYCGEGFYSAGKRLQHSQQEHPEMPQAAVDPCFPAECPICHSKHAHVPALRKHMNIHHKGHQMYIPPQKFPCTWEGCDKSYSTQEALKVHVSRHEGTPRVKCKECEDMFYSHQDMTRHREISHRKEFFECDLCDSFYSTRAALQIHRKNIHGVQSRKYAANRQKGEESTS